MPCYAGILEKCSRFQFLSHDDYYQRLTWNPPSTLNITAVEPDISGYVVCDDIRTTYTRIDMRESGGDSHNLLEYIFPNLRVNITFTVRAVNIVGDGESTNVTYPSCLYIDKSKFFLPCIVSMPDPNSIALMRNEMVSSGS